MKPIVILGKGPSAIKLEPSDKYDVATLNNAIWLCGKPTYAFFNDIEPLELMKDSDFEDVHNIVVPTFLHSQFNPRFNNISQHVHFSKLQEIFPGRFDNVRFHLYELHPGDNLKEEELLRTGLSNANVPSLDEWPGSCGVTAANYLSKFLGYREFIFAGIDIEGGYNPIFNSVKVDDKGNPAFNGQSTAAQPTGYITDYNQMLRLIEKYGGKAVHIRDLSENRRKELGIWL